MKQARQTEANGKMRNMLTVSVIMPLFNKEAFVEQAMASVLAQTLSDIELIVVDNGSTDGSRDAAERRAQADGRVVLLDEARPGASAARNRALSRARGEFLAFVDADDFIDPSLLEKAVAQARRTQADIVCFGHDHYYQDQDVYLYPVRPQAPASFAPEDLGGRLLFAGSPNAWSKLFRRSFVEGCSERFDEGLATAEDMLFTFSLMMRAGRIATVDELLYHYRKDVAGSLTNRGVSRGVQSFDCLERLLGIAGATPHADAFREGIVNESLEQVQYLTQIACDAKEFSLQFEEFRKNWLPRLDALAAEGRIYPEVRHLYERYRRVENPLGLMYELWQESLEVLRHLEGEHEKTLREGGRTAGELRARVAELEGSTTYRVGRAVMALPCALKDRARR